MEKYDLIIVGAGPAGIFTAVELLRHGSKKAHSAGGKRQAGGKTPLPQGRAGPLRQLPPHLCHHHRILRVPARSRTAN